MSTLGNQRVSFDDESLIVVDEDDRVLGHRSKADVHAGDGVLHRAFSIFLFNGRGEVMLQQRSEQKPLWPHYWSNACCSHPRRGETVDEAAARRLTEELGIEAPLEYVYTFRYHARYDDRGAEHEMCAVYLTRCDDPVHVNELEVAATRWVTPEDLDHALAEDPASYTPWLHLEWTRLRDEFSEVVKRYAPSSRRG